MFSQLLGMFGLQGAGHRVRRRATRSRGEELESRTLLATIEWQNRGDDEFDSVFGTQAPLARNVVDAAIADWARVINDFNYSVEIFDDSLDLYIYMEEDGEDFGAETTQFNLGFDLDFGLDPLTGSPTEATIYLNRGFDVTGDGRGDGVGYYLDPSFAVSVPQPTVFGSEEFTMVNNAFSADVGTRPPGWVDQDLDNDGILDGLYDLYSFVAHEIGHAVGFHNFDLLDFEDDYAEDTEITDDINGVGTYWAWNSGRLGGGFGEAGALLTDNNGGPDGDEIDYPGFSGPVHTPGPKKDASGNDVVFNWGGREYFTFDDLMNPTLPWNRRQLIPNHVVAMLADSYDYGIRYPSLDGTFYARLDPATGVLSILGGAGASRDSVRIEGFRSAVDGQDYISVVTDIGNDWTTRILSGGGGTSSYFLASKVREIKVNLGDGADVVHYDNLLTDELVRITSLGGDSVILNGVGFNSFIEINNEESARNYVEVGSVGLDAFIQINGSDRDQVVVGWYRDNGHDRVIPNLQMLGTVQFNVASGNGELTINEANGFTVDTRHISHSGGGVIEYDTSMNIDINMIAGSAYLAVENVSSPTTLAVDAAALGVKSIEIAPIRRTLSSFLGNVQLRGGGFDDALTIYDQERIESGYQISDLSGAGIGATRFRTNFRTNAIDITLMDTVTLHTSDQGSRTDVSGTTYSDVWTIEGGSGADEVFLFNYGGSSVNLASGITFHGGAGNDRVELKDSRAVSSQYYTIDDDSIDLTLGRSIAYSDVEQVRVAGGSEGDTFTLNATDGGAHFELAGGPGIDTFTIGQGNLFQYFESDVRIDGGDGDDRINLFDEDATLPGGYLLGTQVASDGVVEAHFQKWYAVDLGFPFVYRSGELNARGVERLDLQGSALDDVFEVAGTPAGMTYNLFGNDGADEFRIDGHSVRSGINVFGGLPAAPAFPGDTLFVAGTSADTGSYLPGTFTNNGRVTANGQTIDFSGLEPVYVEGFGSFGFTTPRSRDIIDIRSFPARPLPGTPVWTEIAGTSGVVNTGFEVLRVRDIGTLTANFYVNDLIPELPYNAFDPTDVVTIHPEALSGNRVDRLQLMMGFGNDRLIDQTLEGSRATTVLEPIFVTPVEHRMTGTAARIAMGSLRAFNAQGGLVHDVRTIGPGRLVLEEPQPLMTFERADADLILDAAPDGRQRLRSSHSSSTWEFQTTPSGQLRLQAEGDSKFAFTAILTPMPPLLRGGEGPDSLNITFDSNLSPGFAGALIVETGQGDDLISVTSSLPSLPGGLILIGGADNDTYRLDTDFALGQIQIDESGGGVDTLDFSLTTTVGVNVNLGSAATQAVHATNLSLTLNSATVIENVIGGNGNDTLTGGSGNNTLTGGAGNDSLFGGPGNDTYVFGTASAAEADTVTEGTNEGIDTLSFAPLTTAVTLNLNSSLVQTVHTNRTLKLNASGTFENIVGGSGNDVLTGNSLDNSFTGNAGSDTFTGGAGNDALFGGLGNDTYVFGTASAAEADTVTEGTNEGSDALSFASLTTGVTLNLSSSVVQAVHTNRTLKLNAGGMFENIVGGSGNDVLIGNSLDNVFTGNAGNDTMTGGSGNDTYVFGPASVVEADSVAEGTNQGSDTLSFASLTTAATLALNSSLIQAVHTNRTLKLNAGGTFENIIGGSGNDVLTGNSLDNVFTGNAGNDTMTGGGGNDTYVFGKASAAESDSVTEGTNQGSDTLSFASLTTAVTLDLSKTVVQAVHKNWTLKLNAGGTFENIVGGSDDDVLTGNSLDNVFTGNAGNDTMTGGSGNDTYVFGPASSPEADSVAEGTNQGSDTLSFASLTTAVTLDLSKTVVQAVHTNRTLKLNAGGTFENIVGGSGDDVLTGNSLENSFTGNAGNDTMTGGSGNDTYVFGPASAAEADSVAEGANQGSDTLSFASLTTAVTFDLSKTSVQAVHTNRTLKLNSGSTFENIVGGSGDNVLTGNSLNNVLISSGGNDSLFGFAGRDLLVGGSGTDLFYGGIGDDILISGTVSYFNEATRTLNKAGIDAMMAEWTGLSNYTTRVSNLRNGTGLNGANVLDIGTVLDDAALDTLFGEGDEDWFWLFGGDTAPDLAGGEQTN